MTGCCFNLLLDVLFTGQQGRVRRFYPGGDLMDFLYPVHNSDTNFQSTDTPPNSLAVSWFAVTDRTSLLTQLSGMYILCNTVSLHIQSFAVIILTQRIIDVLIVSCVAVLKVFIKAFSPSSLTAVCFKSLTLGPSGGSMKTLLHKNLCHHNTIIWRKKII